MLDFWHKFNQENSDHGQSCPATQEEKNFQKDFQEKTTKAEGLFREKERVEDEIWKARKPSKQQS